MLSRYHKAVVERANAAARKPRISAYLSEKRDELPWILPTIGAVLICWGFGLWGTRSLYVTAPLMFVTISGLIYVWVIYAQARGRSRSRDF